MSDSPTKPEKLAAFEAVVAEYEGPLLRYATRILQDAAGAQDVVQNTFLKMFKSWPDAMAPSPQLSSWLYRVAHNCAVDHVRKESKRHAIHLIHMKDREEIVPPDRGEGFQTSEATERIRKALGILNLRERELVILKVYEEKSYKEIAEITGLTGTNVGYILHHAMKKLSAALREQSAGERRQEQV